MNRTMRLLRHKYNISYVELSKAAEFSTQRLAQIELNPDPSTQYHRDLVRRAFLRVIAARRMSLSALERDFERCKDRLMDEAEKEDFA